MSKNHVEEPNLKLLLNIALPMIVSQASETIMLFVDRLFVSELGTEYISATLSGGLTFFVFNSFFLGIVGYVNALAGQYYGSNENKYTLFSTTQGIYLSAVFYPIILSVIPLIRYTFVFAGHTPEQIQLEYSYFALLTFSSFFFLLRNTMAGFFLGIGETKIVMIANVSGMIINIPLNYALIFGKFGFPKMGLLGAAAGTIGGSFFIALILMKAYIRHRFYKEFQEENIWKFRPGLTKKLLKFGLPAGVEMILNTFAFNIFIQLMHSMGNNVAAAITITFNYDMVAFIPMIGLGVATTAMVAQQVGAGRTYMARKAVFLALRAGYVYAGIMMLLFIFGADPLVTLFLRGNIEGKEELYRLATIMLRLASIYTLADVSQLVFAGALRGAGDTKFVMYLSAALHWLMALCMIVLIRVVNADPIIVWVAFICFVMILGISIYTRFASGAWKNIKVIDSPNDPLHTQAEHLHIQDY
jgi:MATE family multidrug resistance protein